MDRAPSYGHENDWRFVEGVLDGGFAYGPDRYTEGLPTAPTSGVKMRPGNPTQNQIAVAAASFGYETTDMVLTVWASTLRAITYDDRSTLIEPEREDRLIVRGQTWIMQSVKPAVYGTQYVCYCRLSRTVRKAATGYA